MGTKTMANDLRVSFSGNGFEKITQAIRKAPEAAFAALREATFSTERVIKKEFMAVQDGSFLGTSKTGQRRYTKRTVKPGVRTSTGNLKKNTRTVFKKTGSHALSGSIGTNVAYGVELDRDERYQFLEPGLRKNIDQIQKIFKEFIERALK